VEGAEDETMPPSEEGLARWKLEETLRKRELEKANEEKAQATEPLAPTTAPPIEQGKKKKKRVRVRKGMKGVMRLSHQSSMMTRTPMMTAA
jgi:hypothetical protein